MLSASEKSEIKKIVRDEFDRQFEAAVDKVVEKSIKTGKGRKEVSEIVKKSLVDLYKYMWTKRTAWQHEIK